jgi:hypothetical protein
MTHSPRISFSDTPEIGPFQPDKSIFALLESTIKLCQKLRIYKKFGRIISSTLHELFRLLSSIVLGTGADNDEHCTDKTDAAVGKAIKELREHIVGFNDRIAFLADVEFLHCILQFGASIETILKEFDDVLVKYHNMIIGCLQYVSPSTPLLRSCSVSTLTSVKRMLAGFGGVRGALETPDAVQLIAKAVGKPI